MFVRCVRGSFFFLSCWVASFLVSAFSRSNSARSDSLPAPALCACVCIDTRECARARCYCIFAVIIFSLLHIIILYWIYVCIAHIFSLLVMQLLVFFFLHSSMPLRYLWEFVLYPAVLCINRAITLFLVRTGYLMKKKETTTTKKKQRIATQKRQGEKKRTSTERWKKRNSRTISFARAQCINRSHTMRVECVFGALPFLNLLEQRKVPQMMRYHPTIIIDLSIEGSAYFFFFALHPHIFRAHRGFN